MTGSRTSRRTPARKQAGGINRANRPNRSPHGRPLHKRLGWQSWLILSSCLLILILFAWAVIERHLAPASNTSLTRFDAIIVLGSPTDSDGNPTPMQLARVTEAVHEYERGVAPRLIFTGGVDRHRPVEARVMALTAEAQGIPAPAIVEEGQAKDTIQNGCYSLRIMQSHGWHSAEVVSSASHLPRVGLIFSLLPIKWRTHAAPPLEPESAIDAGTDAAMETLKTVRYLAWGRRFEQCQP